MTGRTKTICPPIFDLGCIKRGEFAVNIDSCSTMKKTKLILQKKNYEIMIKTSCTFILANSCQKLSGRGKKELPMKRVREKHSQNLCRNCFNMHDATTFITVTLQNLDK